MLPKRSQPLYRVLGSKSINWSISPTTRAVPVTVGIRREDPKRIWERRAPLSPKAVKELVEGGVKVEFEHCDRRVFRDDEYIAVGAKLRPNLRDANIVIGIKETPLDEVTSGNMMMNISTPQTHMMFSHTAKGQPYNTPLLAKYVEGGDGLIPPFMIPRLIDYELLTDEASGKRTVGFGWFAGVAGVLESLSSMAHAHLENGVATPFLSTPRPHTHPSLESIRSALKTIATRIRQGGTPAALGPFVIGLTGTGNVAQGCLDILNELPIEKVNVEDLDALVKNPNTPLNKIYLVHALPKDYFVRLDGKPYERSHYYENPQSYQSVFCEKIAPYLTLFLNGTGWSTNYPRLMTNDQLSTALSLAAPLGGARFTNIGDISCDIEGGLQFLTEATTLSNPFYKISPPPLPGITLPNVQMMSVDILPASLPLDASYHFSRELFPYVESLVREYQTGGEDKYTQALKRATIAQQGELAEQHMWLRRAVEDYHFQTSARAPEHVRANRQAQADPTIPVPAPATALPQRTLKKNVLMLGSGMVAGPAVDEIAKRDDIQLVVVSNSHLELEKLCNKHLNVQYRMLGMEDPGLTPLIEAADVVISLLPVKLHTAVAKRCLKLKKHMVTASYVSDEMQALNVPAQRAGVLFLNEIGLDPGIDHCSALDLIARIKSHGHQIDSFISFCGGLPAPDVEHTPLRYKFSWSPMGVLLAGLNPSKFLLDYKNQSTPAGDLFNHAFPDVPITEEFRLEGLPNRDSLKYTKSYGLFPSRLRSFVRGTLRYPGFSSLMESFKSLGFFNQQDKIYLQNWHEYVQLAISHHIDTEINPQAVSDAIHALIPAEKITELHNALEWLGLLSTPYGYSKPLPPLPAEPMAPLDIFAYLLSQQLAYGPLERDMVVLSHEIVARNPKTQQSYVHTSSLIEYGTPTASAMARTVGIPVAVAALMVVDGKITSRGVQRPTSPEVYGPMLKRLDELGLRFEEKTRPFSTLKSKTIEASLIEKYSPPALENSDASAP